MNQKLQQLLDSIQQSAHLSDDEKNALAKSIKEVDKEIEITTFKLDRTEKVKRTTAILLEETIEELEQKRKAVEAQNRELEIESSLERVRTVAMGMNKPGDLLNICEVLFKELQLLGFNELRNAMIHKFVDEQGYFLDHDYSDFAGGAITHTPYTGHPVVEKFMAEIRKTDDAFSEIAVAGKELEDWKEFRITNGQAHDPRLDGIPAFYYYFYSIGPADIGISTFSSISTDKRELLKRFRNVFDLAYRRFLDIEKAEAQAREAQIELGLERVRARAMAMQRSEELKELIGTVFTELTKLDLVLTRCVILIFDPVSRDSTWWMANSEAPNDPTGLLVQNHELPPFQAYLKAWQERSLRWQYVLEGKVKKEWDDFLFAETELSHLPDFIIAGMKAPDRVYLNASFNSFGNLTLATLEPLSEEHFDILLRFAKVFDLTYTRFNDLQKAEAQAREAQIETGLERLRSRSMAMHTTSELQEVIHTVHKELLNLNIAIHGGSFIAINSDIETTLRCWGSGGTADTSEEVHLPLYEEPFCNNLINRIKNSPGFFTEEYTQQEKKDFFTFLFNHEPWSKLDAEQKKEILSSPGGYTRSCCVSNHTSIFIINHFGEKFSAADNDILKRFGKVFEQTYTRFLDLQKAEAQAREAQIEVSLERVRSRTMAMHSSDDVSSAILTLFMELDKMGIENVRCGIATINNDKTMKVWSVTNVDEGKTVKASGTFDMNAHLLWQLFYDSWAGKSAFFHYYLSGKEKQEYIAILNNAPDYLSQPILEMPDMDFQSYHFNEGAIWTFSMQPHTEENQQVMNRFTAVFSQTFRRYQDLQKAEAQAREAQIEASLERVRSKAMAMHKSEDLHEAVAVVFEELDKLDIGVLRVGISVLNKEKRCGNVWLTSIDEGKAVQVSGDEPFDIHPLLHGAFEAWLQQEDFYYVLEGEDLRHYYQAVEKAEFRLPASQMLLTESGPRQQHCFVAVYNSGGLFAFRETAFPEEAKAVMKRFAGVFDLTYKRFLDLQKAEEQAREANIEVALERVRSRTLAMQKSDELAETAAVLFKQLILLGIEPNRLYINIIKNETGEAEFWITDEDGSKVSSAFETNLNDNGTFKKMFDGWKSEKKSLVISMQGEELQAYFKYLTGIGVPFKGGLTQTRRVQDIAYFSKGFIGIASPDEQPEDTTLLLERFAAVFNLTYTRFNDLKVAEAHAIQAEEDLVKLQTEKRRAEDALSELQVTQKQLIQSEKMASLGELTAGIAHEIQNPLNFVNNFSEVSNELMDEMNAEIAKGDFAEAKLIANDIKQNLEKINHHGKRADAIVKGMLQHSRSSSATKEPTDINKLADEYLRLAYHGLRAKDKTFNATMKTDYDEAIGNINVIPQDIGRVILNLITNAFYVVTEKKKSSAAADPKDRYEPIVTVSTKKTSDKVLISVKDNGNGIPPKVLDKIFQPFFTTKPTGQGTGLGLSLSYDIVKAHGGELKVETKEGEGTEFIIQIPVI